MPGTNPNANPFRVRVVDKMAEEGCRKRLQGNLFPRVPRLPSHKSDGFGRTEATDLLKMKDGARDRTQYESIFVVDGTRHAVDGLEAFHDQAGGGGAGRSRLTTEA